MQNGCVRTKKIALDFVFPGGLQPPNTEGLLRSPAPYHERIGHARRAAKLVSLVYLAQPNNKTNPRNQWLLPFHEIRFTFHVSRFTGLLP